MTSVLSSVDKIKGITEKDVGLNKVKNSLMGKVELNMKSKQNKLNKLEMAILIMYKAIKKLEYLEQK